MGPKFRAAMIFLERGGGEALITDSGHLLDAVAGRGGTHIIR
jgi:carbamate kinase